MSIFERALHIPAEPSPFARPWPSPQRGRLERVLLPLVARPAPRFHAAIALAAFAALACLVMGAEAIRSSGGVAAGFFAAALLPAGIAVTGLRDALITAPLTIGADGIDDRRLGLGPIRWAEVARAECIPAANGIAAVRLTLARDGPPRGNPFRIGGWSFDWTRRRRTRLVALMLLDARAHTLAQTILVLAARNGAEVPPDRDERLVERAPSDLAGGGRPR